MAKSKSAKKVLDSYTVKGTHKVVKGEFAPLVFETWKVFLGEDFWARHFGILSGSGQSYLFSLFVMRKTDSISRDSQNYWPFV